MSITSGFIDITSCNAYFAADTITDDMLIRTGSNYQRIVLATLSTSNATMILSNNIVSFASNVGVGKSNPQYALDVNGVVNATSLYVSGAPYIGSQWTSSNNFVYVLGSNVGIGKSNPAYLLDVNGIVNASSLYVAGAPYIGSQWSNATNNVFIMGSNVGIGTTSPQANLQVAGNVQVNGSTATRGFVLTRSAGILSNFVPPPVPGLSNTSSNVALYTAGSNTTDSIQFFTGSNVTEKARITGSGFVGIGISNPSYLLSFRGTDASVNGPHLTAYTTADAFPTSQILNWAHNNVNIAFDSYYNGTNWLSSTTTGNILLAKTAGNLTFMVASNVAAGSSISAWSNAISIQASSGNIGIGTILPSYPLHITAGAASTSIFASGDIIGLSDASVKTDLQRIKGALEKVKSISGYTFKRTDVVSENRHAGVIAQEVQKVLPEVVTETDGKLCVAYGNMIALLVEAIKDLSDNIDAIIYGRL